MNASVASLIVDLELRKSKASLLFILTAKYMMYLINEIFLHQTYYYFN